METEDVVPAVHYMKNERNVDEEDVKVDFERVRRGGRDAYELRDMLKQGPDVK